jgi:Circadian oscillating protein COP23
MRSRQLAQLLTISALTLAATVATQNPARSEASRFTCSTSNGKPTTVANTPQADVPVIVWDSEYFSGSGYPPQTRCEMVSARFETFRQEGTLDYLTTGVMNGMPVVCVSNSVGSGCRANGLLFTLKAGTDPNQALQDLMDVRYQASGAMYQSVSDARPYEDRDRQGNLYIDMNVLLNVAANVTQSDEAEPIF